MKIPINLLEEVEGVSSFAKPVQSVSVGTAGQSKVYLPSNARLLEKLNSFLWFFNLDKNVLWAVPAENEEIFEWVMKYSGEHAIKFNPGENPYYRAYKSNNRNPECSPLITIPAALKPIIGDKVVIHVTCPFIKLQGVELKEEGKTKILHPMGRGKARMVFKDVVTKDDGKKAMSVSKGEITNQINAKLMAYLSSKKIPVSYRKKEGKNSSIVTVLDMIPLEVVVRFNHLRRLPLPKLDSKEFISLSKEEGAYSIEFFHKVEGDPYISEGEILHNEICSEDHLDEIKDLAIKSTILLVALFLEVDLILADIKLEFGLDSKGRVVLGDEITPDNFRLKKIRGDKVISLDKDIFRENVDKIPDEEVGRWLLDGYAEVLKRLETVLTKDVEIISLPHSITGIKTWKLLSRKK